MDAVATLRLLGAAAAGIGADVLHLLAHSLELGAHAIDHVAAWHRDVRWVMSR